VLATLREAAGPEHAIWHAPSADTAVDLLVGGRCSILIADLGACVAMPPPARSAARAVPELILMATGRRDEEHSVAMLVSDQRIYRFLHKAGLAGARQPVPVGRDTALQRIAQRRADRSHHRQAHRSALEHSCDRHESRVVLLSLAAGGAFWWQSRKEPA
jgi:hypothetical protein